MQPDIHKIQKRAELIGHICFQYSFLDYLVSNVIWHILKLDVEAGKIVTGSLDIRPKLDMAVTLASHYGVLDEISAHIKTMKNRIEGKNGAINKRNRLIHGVFASAPGDPVVVVESHRNKRHRQRIALAIDEIQSTLNEITQEATDLSELMEKHGINVH
ncbi:hypothetical protein [Halomonas sp. M20]|uniref:hypothetical protein n=1 Tax=Halomonas sp. M20 TaxID=2763264 RepID=UPI001D0B2ACB|nr:hypothetical protein [Halomonas sp. M20]